MGVHTGRQAHHTRPGKEGRMDGYSTHTPMAKAICIVERGFTSLPDLGWDGMGWDCTGWMVFALGDAWMDGWMTLLSTTTPPSLSPIFINCSTCLSFLTIPHECGFYHIFPWFVERGWGDGRDYHEATATEFRPALLMGEERSFLFFVVYVEWGTSWRWCFFGPVSLFLILLVLLLLL